MLHESELDPEMKAMTEEELATLESGAISSSEISSCFCFQRPNDERNVILEIRAGTGGDEADCRCRHLPHVLTLRGAPGLEGGHHVFECNRVGGFKEIIALIEGKGVYSRLKYESGVHRVQRVPATEASGVSILPRLPSPYCRKQKKSKLPFRKKICGSTRSVLPVRWQSVNTTYSAVRITHIPRDWWCRVRTKNLKSRIGQKDCAFCVRGCMNLKWKSSRKRWPTSGVPGGTGDRSEKIRTYNYPQNRVSDHRIGLTINRLDYIIDGTSMNSWMRSISLSGRAAQERTRDDPPRSAA